MPTLSEIQKMVDIDMKIDQTNVDKVSMQLPYTHNKYFKMFTESRLALVKLEAEYSKLYRDKYKYYKFEYEITLDKTETRTFISGDSEIITCQEKVSFAKEKVHYLENVIDNINRTSFNIKNLIEYIKFKNGVI